MMKKILFLFISLILLQQITSAKALDGMVKFPRTNIIVSLEIADSDEEKTQGLMSRENLPEKRGMVFIFNPIRTVTFWMKDTLIPLDMIFINRGKIVNIVKNAIPNQTSILYPSGAEVSEVIEVNGGFSDKYSIKIGDTVIFENIPSIDYSQKSKLMIIEK